MSKYTINPYKLLKEKRKNIEHLTLRKVIISKEKKVIYVEH